MADRSPRYSEAALAAITGVLARAAPGAVIDGAAVRECLADLLVVVGQASGDAFDAAFNVHASEPVPHAELAQRYRALAAAETPFAPGLITAIMRSELNALARARRSRPRAARRAPAPAFLARLAADLAALREYATALAASHQRAVHRGSPRKLGQDTLLLGLAELYLDSTGLAGSRYDLPHAPASHFIQFAHAALRPAFGLTEVSPEALSKRWKRLKDAERAAARDDDPDSATADEAGREGATIPQD